MSIRLSNETTKVKVSVPRWIFLQLLESCNLRCKMCFEWGETGSYKSKNDLAQLDINIIKTIIEDCKSARPFYELYGGEPLMYPEFGEVVEMIGYYGSRIHFPTNGVLLEKYADILVENEVDSVWVSMDGKEEYNDFQRGKGVYQKALGGMKKLIFSRESMGKTSPKVGTSTVITPLNYLHIEEYFFDIMDKVRLDQVSFELQSFITHKEHEQYAHLLRNEFGIEEAPIAKGFLRDISEFYGMDIKRIAQQLKNIQEYCEKNHIYFNSYPKGISVANIEKYFSARWNEMNHIKSRCPFPWISTEVNARGDVASCHSLYDLTYGNVYENSILEIWNNERYKKFRNLMKKNLLPVCPACCLFYNEKPGMK